MQPARFQMHSMTMGMNKNRHPLRTVHTQERHYHFLYWLIYFSGDKYVDQLWHNYPAEIVWYKYYSQISFEGTNILIDSKYRSRRMFKVSNIFYFRLAAASPFHIRHKPLHRKPEFSYKAFQLTEKMFSLQSENPIFYTSYQLLYCMDKWPKPCTLYTSNTSL